MWGPVQCFAHLDEIGKLAYYNEHILYKYKGVTIPPLQQVDDILTISKCGDSNSIILNNIINSQIERKKLKFNQKKCVKISVGNISCECHIKMKVHNKNVINSHEELYLGNIVNSSCNFTDIINQRISKGYGIVAQIKAMLKDVPFGPNRVKSGLILREAKFINAVLFAAETWHNTSINEIKRLEKVDECLLRSILFDCNPKTPIEFLHLETSTFKLRHIISIRRLMFLREILSKETNEVLYKVFDAQSKDPSKGDFVKLCQEDFKNIKLEISNEEIIKLSKSEYKQIVKLKMAEYCIQQLKEAQTNHRKIKDIQYNNEFQRYLCDPSLNFIQRRTIFQFRAKIVPNIKANFKGTFKDDLTCPLKCNNKHIDSQENLLSCDKLTKFYDGNNAKHEDFFGTVDQQKKAAILFQNLLIQRNELLKYL